MNGSAKVRIIWKQEPIRSGVIPGIRSGVFPLEAFGRACAYSLGKPVSKAAKEFVENWCGLEGCISKIISIEEVEE